MAPSGSKGAVTGDAAAEADPRSVDDALVAAAQAGDQAAFGQLVERYQDRVVNFCYRRTRNHEDALDVAQEVFVKAFRAIKNYQGQSAFYTWVYRIAVNTTTTHWQRGRKHQGVLSLDGIGFAGDDGERRYEPSDDQGIAPPDQAIRDEDVRRVREAIGELEGTDNLLIVLRDIEGLSYEEIAETLEMKLGSVKSHLHRARGRLREKLRAMGVQG